MKNLFDVSGKKAIVTGGSRGLGKGMAEGLMEHGCEVALIASTPQVRRVTQDYAAMGYKCHGVQADLGKRRQVYGSFDQALSHLGGDLDILVTAAGIQRRYPAEDFPIEQWDEVLSVNLDAVFIQCQLAGKIMLKKGYGKIINIASMVSFFGGQTVAAYSAAKGAVAQMTKAMANDWASRGININAIAPGYMDTQMIAGLKQDKKRMDYITARIPSNRWGTPQDMKGAVIFLSSQASDYVNGAIIPVDGGYLIR
ncbi:MAG: SDR family oxidoreductase [Christensenellales bacterium]|jgi:2-deoxy-D-gluconate 3-dehydrogenase